MSICIGVCTRLPFLFAELFAEGFNGYFRSVVSEFIFEAPNAIGIKLLSLVVGPTVCQRVVCNFGKTHYSASQLLRKPLPF